MSREVCIHGVELPHFGPGETSVTFVPCMECLAEMGRKPYDTEREELAAKCYVGLIASTETDCQEFWQISLLAFSAADAFIKVRDEERKK